MLTRVRDEEHGLAMVVAIMISFIVLLLSVFVMQLSIHNSSQSAYDRKRVTSVAAAEAGIDKAWATIESTMPGSLPCATPITGTLASAPGTASFSVTTAYYQSNGTLLSGCPSQTNVPAFVLLTSTGTTDGAASRKMQAYAALSPQYSGTGAAILANTGTSFSNSLTVNGNTGNDADIYINSGDLSISNLPNIYGNIYVSAGSYTQTNNSIVHGSVWANGSGSISNPAVITGDLTSSTSSLSGTGTINGSARAGTTIASSLIVGGSKLAGSPQGAPPTMPFPYVCWNTVSPYCVAQSSDWTNAGYTVHTDTDCGAARTYLTTGTISGNVVERITGTCILTISNSDTISFSGNLAIFMDRGISIGNLTNWNGTSGKSLFLLVNFSGQTTSSCASANPNYDITATNNPNFNNGINVSLYTPCTVHIANNQSGGFNGQIIGNGVDITNNITLNFRPVLIPGAGILSGFHQSIVYMREVQ